MGQMIRVFPVSRNFGLCNLFLYIFFVLAIMAFTLPLRVMFFDVFNFLDSEDDDEVENV